MSVIIGLTGPTGSGKSSVKAVAETLGIKVVDCDILARKAVESGTDGLKALVDVFGSEILNPDGALNRKKLAEIAFISRENTELLNHTIFPHILKLAMCEAEGGGNIIFDAPTLFESGLNEICHKTVAVLARSDIRLKRIINRDNLTEKQAVLRMSAGKDDQFYKEKADYILFNNGDIDEFNTKILQILKEIIGG